MNDIFETKQIILISSKKQIKSLFLICKTKKGNIEKYNPKLRKTKTKNQITFKIEFLIYSECDINIIQNVGKGEKKYKYSLNYKDINLQFKNIKFEEDMIKSRIKLDDFYIKTLKHYLSIYYIKKKNNEFFYSFHNEVNNKDIFLCKNYICFKLIEKSKLRKLEETSLISIENPYYKSTKGVKILFLFNTNEISNIEIKLFFEENTFYISSDDLNNIENNLFEYSNDDIELQNGLYNINIINKDGIEKNTNLKFLKYSNDIYINTKITYALTNTQYPSFIVKMKNKIFKEQIKKITYKTQNQEEEELNKENYHLINGTFQELNITLPFNTTDQLVNYTFCIYDIIDGYQYDFKLVITNFIILDPLILTKNSSFSFRVRFSDDEENKQLILMENNNIYEPEKVINLINKNNEYLFIYDLKDNNVQISKFQILYKLNYDENKQIRRLSKESNGYDGDTYEKEEEEEEEEEFEEFEEKEYEEEEEEFEEEEEKE